MAGRSRFGLTLLEVIVALTCVTVLLAILLPAVQAARAGSRKIRCRNHLRQIGTAAHNHHSAKGHMPTRLMDLLPHLEQSGLHRDLTLFQSKAHTDGAAVLPSNLATVATFACPDDQVRLVRQDVSYYLNDGTQFRDIYRHFDGDRPANGLVPPAFSASTPRLQPTRAADIVDGLSNTAMFSERLQFSALKLGDDPQPPSRSAWRLDGSARTADQLVALYAQSTWALAADLSEFKHRRNYLFDNSSYDRWSIYDHILTPNSRPVLADRPVGTRDHALPTPSSRPATSLHRGGVNVLLCDGHVRFVSADIDRAVWRAIGTRDGREAIQTGF